MYPRMVRTRAPGALESRAAWSWACRRCRAARIKISENLHSVSSRCVVVTKVSESESIFVEVYDRSQLGPP